MWIHSSGKEIAPPYRSDLLDRFLMRGSHCEDHPWVVLSEQAERLIRLEWLAYNRQRSSNGEKKQLRCHHFRADCRPLVCE
jgi:hypothetical protein